MSMLRSPRTAVHLVTVLEEMPVQETADGIDELRAVGLPVGAHHGQPGRAPRPRRRRARGRASTGTLDRGEPWRRPQGAGIAADDALVDGLLTEGHDHAERRALEDRQRALVDGLGVPIVELPRPAPTASTSAALYELAERCVEAGARDEPVPHRAPPARRGARPGRPAGRGRRRRPPLLDVDALLADRGIGIIVCCGSGGVGKTTTSAALALRAAEQGRKVVVLTIDPARRLAQSMGLDRARQHAPAGRRASSGRAAAASTR